MKNVSRGIDQSLISDFINSPEYNHEVVHYDNIKYLEHAKKEKYVQMNDIIHIHGKEPV